MQIGLLVVCVPSQFLGGDLIDCHHGQEINFNWSQIAIQLYNRLLYIVNASIRLDLLRITLTYILI